MFGTFPFLSFPFLSCPGHHLPGEGDKKKATKRRDKNWEGQDLERDRL